MTLQGSIKGAKPHTKQSQRNKNITRNLATLVAVGNVAKHIVECEEFQELISQLDQKYKVPSCAALDRETEALLIELKKKISAKLQEAGKVAVCTDIWSRKGLTLSFLV